MREFLSEIRLLTSILCNNSCSSVQRRFQEVYRARVRNQPENLGTQSMHAAGTWSGYKPPHSLAGKVCKLMPANRIEAWERVSGNSLHKLCTRCNSGNWNHFVSASWRANSNQPNSMRNVADTKFCPRNRTFSQKRACHTRKTVATSYPASCPCNMSFTVSSLNTCSSLLSALQTSLVHYKSMTDDSKWHQSMICFFSNVIKQNNAAK